MIGAEADNRRSPGPAHGNRRYVKSAHEYREPVRRFALPLLVGLCWTGSASAETIYPGQVEGARLAGGRVAYVLGANAVIATRGPRSWQDTAIGFPGPVELDGFAVRPDGTSAVLARDLAGHWLALWDGRRIVHFHRDSKQARFGPAGLALDRAGRPVVAYALWYPSHRTFLRLARLRRNSVSVQAVTRDRCRVHPVGSENRLRRRRSAQVCYLAGVY